TDLRRRAHPAATASRRSSRHHPFSAPGTGFFATETKVRKTHWKSPPLVGIFGASPHVGRKRECVVVDAAPIETGLSPCILGKCREIFAKCRETDIASLLKATRSQHLG